MNPYFYSLQFTVMRAMPLGAPWPQWFNVRSVLAKLANEENQ